MGLHLAGKGIASKEKAVCVCGEDMTLKFYSEFASLGSTLGERDNDG